MMELKVGQKFRIMSGKNKYRIFTIDKITITREKTLCTWNWETSEIDYADKRKNCEFDEKEIFTEMANYEYIPDVDGPVITTPTGTRLEEIE
jgi:hypothetical protein